MAVFFVLLFTLCLMIVLLPEKTVAKAAFLVAPTNSHTVRLTKAYNNDSDNQNNNDIENNKLWQLVLQEYVEQYKFIIESKDEQLRAKDEKYKHIIESKDEQLRAKDEKYKYIIESKDERIQQSDKLYQAILKEKDKMITMLHVDILKLKGTLNCRGVVEFIGNGVSARIDSYQNRRKGYAFALKWGAEEAYRGNEISDIIMLREAYESYFKEPVDQTAECCSAFYVDLCSELDKSIHQASWSGPAVKNTLHEYPDKTEVVRYLCEKRLGLSLE